MRQPLRATLLSLTLMSAFPAAVAGQEAGAVTPLEADAIRDTLRRPPAGHAADWVDVAEFPLKVIGWPLDLLLVRFPGWLGGQLTAPRPPSVFVRTYRDASEWGLKPAIRTTIGPRSGAAVEARFDRFHPFYVHSAISRRLSQRHRVGVAVTGRRTWLTAEAKWQRDAETPFYGVGSRTDEEDRAFYLRDWWDLAVSSGHRMGRALVVVAGAGYENNRIGEPVSGDAASIFDEFETGGLFGTSQRTEYLRLELGTTLDLTRWNDFQPRGVTIGLTGWVFRGLDETDSDFHLLSGFVQTYVPVNRQQTLALRAIGDVARGDGGSGVPFYHLPSLGGSRSGLGFPSRRFVDNDMLALMSEWRYEVWRELHSRLRAEMFVFYHYGAVARRLDDIGGDAWHPSYGLGMRFSRPTALLGLAYLGFSSEGMTAGIRGSWPF